MTHIGKRIFILLINLALGESGPKITFEWLIDKNIITGSKYDQRRVQQIIHHWKMSSGEILQNYTNSSSKNKQEQHIFSVHEGKRFLENEKKSLFKCVVCFHEFDRKEKLKRHVLSVHDEKNAL